jgi:hypothetical protein
MVCLSTPVRDDGAGKLGYRQLRKNQCRTGVNRLRLGPENPITSCSAWNLLITLRKMEEREAAQVVLQENLLWLLKSEPATLSEDHRKIRGDAPSSGGGGRWPRLTCHRTTA